MAGPLSHILDPPRPASGRDLYPASPSSYASQQHSPQAHPQSQQQSRNVSRVGASVSPNTRNHTVPPVSLPPPVPSGSSSTLQVRLAPPTAPTASSVHSPTLSPPLKEPATVAQVGHLRTLSHGSTDARHQPGHRAASPSSPALTATSAPAVNSNRDTIDNTAKNNPPPANPQTNHRGTNLYACRDCGRSYSRPEHLVRHVQTHTLGRRFVCDICQKSFARKDLLRRHVANHDNDSPKKRRRTTNSPGAGRVSHACRSCAVARVKCDDTKPCKRCVTRKLECVSTEAPSTAAMHLMHFSANAHSSAQGSSKDDNEQEKEDVAARRTTAAASINNNGPAQSTTTTSREESHSPGSMSFSNHQAQPRPLPTTAPQSMHELAPLHHNNQRQHHRHHSQHRYSNDRLGSSVTPLPSFQARFSSHEPSQLLTPETYAEKGAPIDPLSELQPATSAMDPSRLPFSEFLRDVVHENSAETTRSGPVQGLTLLDFCDQGNLDLNEDDLGLLDHWNVDGHQSLSQGIRLAPGGHIRDGSTDMAQVRQDLVKMWTNSTWTPANNGKSRNSGTAASPASTPDMRDRIDRITPERLEPSARDRVLAMVLSTCRPGSSAMRVASSFPSVEVMDVLVQNFLLSMANQASQWIHFPTFRLDGQSTEWVAMAAAAGAAQSSMSTLRKLGFILQDAARATLPTQFEDNTPTARDIGLVQALLLAQEIGLWSGNRRRMELAQSQLAIPVTLLRYRNKFLRSSYPHVAVDPSDDGAELEAKWRLWVERERWKRLVFHCLLRDAQCSMATLTNQAISYAELTLPLPEPKELWMAGSALEWKAEYLQRHADRGRPLPSMGDLFYDIHQLSGNMQRLDVQASVSIYLHGFWALILEYRRLSAIHKARSNNGSVGGNQNLLLGSRHQELLKDLQSFQLLAQEWPDVTSEEHMVLSFLIMSLHVSLDDLQLFAGKEGEDQARRTYPVLQQWASSSEARSAVSCASQILRYAKAVAPGQLKDFCAVAVQQAALALWAYGVINKANNKGPPALPPLYQSSDPVYLDGTDTMPIQRFVGFGQGRPAIRGPTNGESASESSLDDPRACMAITQEVLRSNMNDGCESLPPMVENLCTLVKQLGDAAWAVGLGSA